MTQTTHPPVPLARPLPVRRRAPPTVLACTTCQLLGRRRLTCSESDACARLPRALPLGPALLLAWLATAAAFVAAIW